MPSMKQKITSDLKYARRVGAGPARRQANRRTKRPLNDTSELRQSNSDESKPDRSGKMTNNVAI